MMMLKSSSINNRNHTKPQRAIITNASSNNPDVLIVGGGHNGLTAAALLAKQGIRCHVLEQKNLVGGAAITENPFPKVRGLSHNTGAYLLGVMQPELLNLLELDITLKRRDPHYFLPTTSNKYLLFGSDTESTNKQFLNFFSQQDASANQALQQEISALRDDIAPSWFLPPLSVEESAEKFIRPELRETFISLCRGTVRDYLDRFDFKSNLLKTMYATTDGFSGLTGGWDTPGSGYNFLLHNMCRLPNADGTWMIVEGGMGRVTQQLAATAQKYGATISTNKKIEKIIVDHQNKKVQGVVIAETGEEIKASTVIVNADPFTLRKLTGSDAFSSELNRKLDSLYRPGTTMKVNLALGALPKYSCCPEDLGQHRTTTHLLPDDEESVIQMTERAFHDAMNGKLPEFPTMEVYTQTSVDPTLRDAGVHQHSAALFVQWVPHTITGSTWEKEKDKYVDHLLNIWERYAPGVSSLVDDVLALAPPDIEQYFGITGGHIHHVCNTIAFSDRFPHRVDGIDGLYSCSAGTHPGGSVIGCGGYNAAVAVVEDRSGHGKRPDWIVSSGS